VCYFEGYTPGTAAEGGGLIQRRATESCALLARSRSPRPAMAARLASRRRGGCLLDDGGVLDLLALYL